MASLAYSSEISKGPARLIKTTFDPTHFRSSMNLTAGELAQMYFAAQGYDKAEELFRGELDWCTLALSFRNHVTLGVANNLAVTLMELRKYDEARDLLVRACTASPAVSGAESDQSICIQCNLALCYYYTSELTKARDVMLEIARIRESTSISEKSRSHFASLTADDRVWRAWQTYAANGKAERVQSLPASKNIVSEVSTVRESPTQTTSFKVEEHARPSLDGESRTAVMLSHGPSKVGLHRSRSDPKRFLKGLSAYNLARLGRSSKEGNDQRSSSASSLRTKYENDRKVIGRPQLVDAYASAAVSPMDRQSEDHSRLSLPSSLGTKRTSHSSNHNGTDVSSVTSDESTSWVTPFVPAQLCNDPGHSPSVRYPINTTERRSLASSSQDFKRYTETGAHELRQFLDLEVYRPNGKEPQAHKAFLDTGADRCCVAKAFAKHMGYEHLIKTTDLAATAADARSIDVVGAVEMDIRIHRLDNGQKTFNVNFMVLSNSYYDIYLSRHFIGQNMIFSNSDVVAAFILTPYTKLDKWHDQEQAKMVRRQRQSVIADAKAIRAEEFEKQSREHKTQREQDAAAPAPRGNAN